MISIKSWQVIDEQEFSEMVSELYGRPYSLQQAEELGQDSIRQVDSEDEVSEEEQQAFEAWRDRELNNVPNSRYEFYKELHERDPATYPLLPATLSEGEIGWDTWWEREFSPPLQPLINDLCERGKLPRGRYRMHVQW